MYVWGGTAQVSFDSQGPARRGSRGPERLRSGDPPGRVVERPAGESESQPDLRHQSPRVGATRAARQGSGSKTLSVLLVLQHLRRGGRQDSGRDGGFQSGYSVWTLEGSGGTGSSATGQPGIQSGVSAERDSVRRFAASAI